MNGASSDALSKAWKIPGLYRKSEAGYLLKLAQRRGLLVEIGCWQGRTTSLLVQGAKTWNASVVTIDPFTPMPNGNIQSSPELWRANLKRVGLTAPELIVSTSDDAARDWTREISLLFVDGAHSQMAVMHDLRNWTPFIKVGGVLALHDMFYPSITGVALAVADWWDSDRSGERSPNWKLLGLHDFTIAFERIAK